MRYKISATVGSFRTHNIKKSLRQETKTTKIKLYYIISTYHIQFCDLFRTANSSWPELLRSCTAKGRSPG